MIGMRVLVVGQGGREHAIVEALHRAEDHPQIFVAPGNPGMEPLAERIAVAPTDVESLVGWSKKHEIDFVVVGPEAPLAAGLADALREAGIATLGPGAAGARLETSKRYAKELLLRLGLPTASFRIATSAEQAESILAGPGVAYPVVLKADGLAAGKGVVIAENAEEARATVHAWMREGELGEAGETILIEEFLRGEEASVLVISDGERWMLFPAARDHKRIFDGDTGPNTGGMGAFAPARVPTEEDAIAIAKRVVDPVLKALRDEKQPYRGILYLGLMLTERGPQVLEFNARFGDPEAQVVLPLVTEDLLPLLWNAALGRLPAERHATFVEHEGAAVCVVLASPGYPQRPATGDDIEGLDGNWPHGIRVFFAGVDRHHGQWVTSGGRVLGVTARAMTVDEAREAAYDAVAKIYFPGMQYRRDIALAPEEAGRTEP
ncbi:MAG TPA: phosphoribosylamine--glycine ligase [Candidatus Eisenbacteria bacterium]|nr:phosphoribosylamine--glycine ligase [Candidatus Eisenbacteria bacterium]